MKQKSTLIFTSFLLVLLNINLSLAQNTDSHTFKFSNVDGFSGYVKFTTKYKTGPAMLIGNNQTLVLTKYNTSPKNLNILLEAGYDLRGLPSSGVTPERYEYIINGRVYIYGLNRYKATSNSRLQLSKNLGDFTTPEFDQRTVEDDRSYREQHNESMYEAHGGFHPENISELYIFDFKNKIQQILQEKGEGDTPEKKNESAEENSDDFWSGGGAGYANFELDIPEGIITTDKGFYELNGTMNNGSTENISGEVIGQDYNNSFEVENGQFKIKLLLKSGMNNFKIKIHNSEKNVAIKCTRNPVALRASLVWNTSGSDIDLYMEDNQNNTCYYSNKISGDMRLDVDNTTGYGPENIFVENPSASTYTIKVKNFARGEGTEATVYIYQNERITNTKRVRFSSSKQVITIGTISYH